MAIITISRGTFSGGQQLAECLGQALGYRVLSREVLAEAAVRYGVSEADLAAAMRSGPKLRDRFLHDRRLYLAFVQSALCEEAVNDRVVYHGHAGHLLLRGVRHVLRVRLIAPLEYRIKEVERRQGLSSEDAANYVARVDRDREKWTRFLYGVKWQDPALYDLVMNLECLDVGLACSAITTIATQPRFQADEASRKALEELRLLSNMSMEGRALMQISLVGQSDLRETLDSPKMEQLWQRIIAWHHLQPLNLSEVKDYVEHRLTAADWNGVPRLDDDIYPLLHDWSQGVPRKVNILMDRLLLFGYLEERPQLGREELQAVIDELGQEFGRRATRAPEPRRAEADAVSTQAEDVEEISRRFAELERNVAELLGPARVQEFLELDEEPDLDSEMDGTEALLTRIERLEKLLVQLRQKKRSPNRQGH